MKDNNIIPVLQPDKLLGSWGALINIDPNNHITQTNKNAGIGLGAHCTSQTTGISFRSYFNQNGDFVFNDWD